MKRSVIFSIVLAAGLSVLIMEVLPVQKKAQRIIRSMRSGRRRYEYLDIYRD